MRAAIGASSASAKRRTESRISSWSEEKFISGLEYRFVGESDRGERSAVDRSSVDSDRVRQVPAYTEVGQGCVAVDDGDAEAVRQVRGLALPQEILRALLAERVLRIRETERRLRHAGVHERVLTIEMPEPQRFVETLVFGIEREVLVRTEVAVARQGRLAAIVEERLGPEVLRTFPAEERQEHRLVVAHQERAVVLLLQRDQVVDHALRARAAVDVVADEDQSVALLERQPREELGELVAHAVDVTDRVQHREELIGT